MRFSILILLGLLASNSYAQRLEVNPNVQWRYIRTQEINFQSGRTYQYEFPAEKGFDYVFNLTHNLDNAYLSISVFDVQYKAVASLTDSSNKVGMDLNFRVPENGTFIVVLSLSSDAMDVVLPTTLSLIRRPIVKY